jgi:hypothetical protein
MKLVDCLLKIYFRPELIDNLFPRNLLPLMMKQESKQLPGLFSTPFYRLLPGPSYLKMAKTVNN